MLNARASSAKSWITLAPFSPNATASPAKGYMANRPYAITHWVTTSNFIPPRGNPNDSDLSGHDHPFVMLFLESKLK
jgi:hypothetical protein